MTDAPHESRAQQLTDAIMEERLREVAIRDEAVEAAENALAEARMCRLYARREAEASKRRAEREGLHVDRLPWQKGGADDADTNV